MKKNDTELLLPEKSIDYFLRALRDEFNVDLSGYSQVFLSRRINGLLQRLQFDSFDLLLCFIRHKPENLKILEKELSINYTEMFRNPGFFSSLRRKVFPFLATYPRLKIWHAGCSTGEEVFSLAIHLQEVGLLDRCNIIATDKDFGVLRKASDAIFDTSRMQEFTNNYYLSGGRNEFSNYYSSGYGQLKFFDNLRRRISFQQHNLHGECQFEKVNLVLCRNVLIYFNPFFRDKAVGVFSKSLSNLGYLGLGTTETLSFNKYGNEFFPIDKKEKIYRKVSLSEWKNCKN